MHKVPNRGDICKVREVISKATGKPPRGWIGPGLTETWETHDLLVEGGCDYVADWVLDDQPVWLKTRTKPILSVPYTQECNDVAMMLTQHHKASGYCDNKFTPTRPNQRALWLCRYILTSLRRRTG